MDVALIKVSLLRHILDIFRCESGQCPLLTCRDASTVSCCSSLKNILHGGDDKPSPSRNFRTLSTQNDSCIVCCCCCCSLLKSILDDFEKKKKKKHSR